MIAEQIGEE